MLFGEKLDYALIMLLITTVAPIIALLVQVGVNIYKEHRKEKPTC